jgi:two-component system, OmpR family, alkaline phosphatase synthesis response regulator PhoP
MHEAWIMSSDHTLAGEAAAAVAELGLTPRRAGVNGGGRPRAQDGGAERLPQFMFVLAATGEPVPVEVCSQLRADDNLAAVPVLLALDEHHLRAQPDISAADELIVRPYSAAELALRIRRARLAQGETGAEEIVRAGSLEVNLATYQVTIDGRAVDFAYMEYELLKFLITHPQRVFSREALLSAVWNYEYFGGGRTVDVHVRRVRAKLGREHAERIKTVRGVGYRFER